MIDLHGFRFHRIRRMDRYIGEFEGQVFLIVWTTITDRLLGDPKGGLAQKVPLLIEEGQAVRSCLRDLPQSLMINPGLSDM